MSRGLLPSAKHVPRAVLAVVVPLAAVAVLACATQTKGDREYRNTEFGFSMRYPSTWILTDARDQAHRDELAQSHASNPEEMKALQQQEREVVSLKHEVGGVVAGRLSVRWASAASADFLAGYLQTLREGMSSSMKLESVEQEAGVDLAGRKFSRTTIVMSVQSAPVYQEIYVVDVPSGALMFSATSAKREMVGELSNVVRGISFEPRGASPTP